jgi:hypothetical protein
VNRHAPSPAPALTAAALTVLYALTWIINPPLAAGVAGFYLAAVVILVAAPRFAEWLRTIRRAPGRRGRRGPVGPTGPAGPIGPVGMTGPQGAHGNTPDPADLPDPPGGERRTDPWSRTRITKVLRASIEDRKYLHTQVAWMRRHVRYVEGAVVIFGVTLVLSLSIIAGVPGVRGGVLGDGGLIGKNADRAAESKKVADGLARLVHRIQTERATNIRLNCLDQNRRHDQTVSTLDARLRLAQRTATPAQVRQIRQSRDFTVSLIGALAPRRDCQHLVAVQAPSVKPRP